MRKSIGRNELSMHEYSLDWRFLLPGDREGYSLVVSGEGTRFAEALANAGFRSFHWQEGFSFLLDHPAAGLQQLCAVAFPFGFPSNLFLGEYALIDILSATRGVLHPGGYLLIGFHGLWSAVLGERSEHYYSTPDQIRDLLSRSGYNAAEVYGALPDLEIPEYILRLEFRPLDFMIRHRFRRRPLARTLLRALLRGLGAARFSALMPCHYAVAIA